MRKECVVVCPVYKELTDEEEVFAVINNRWKLKDYKWIFVGPTGLERYIVELTEVLGLENVGYESFSERYFSGIRGYNELCKSNEFYARFDSYEYMLVCQLDCLVLGTSLDPWIDKRMSFYGAVLYDSYTEGVDYNECRFGRNGGFSLRRVDDFLSCLEKQKSIPLVAYKRVSIRGASALHRLRLFVSRILYRYTKGRYQARINEDLFWTVCMAFVYPSVFKVANRELSMLFSIERMNPEQERSLIFTRSMIPFGCHAWNRYNRQIWLELVVECGLVEERCYEFLNIGKREITLKEEQVRLTKLLSAGGRS